MRVLIALIGLSLAASAAAQEAPAEPPAASYFHDIRPIIQRSCQGCHQPASKMSGLDLTTYEGLRKGGAKGASFVAGKPAESLLVAYVSGEREPRMPLAQDPLPEEQIDLFRRWVEAGGADDTPDEVKDSISAGEPPVYHLPPVITSVAYSPDGSLLAVGGYREVLLHNSDGSGLVGRLVGLSEKVQSIAFTPDGKTLLAAGGTPARFGEVQLWDVAKQTLKQSITTCADTIFGASISPDGAHFAYGCPDQTVRIHDLATGTQLHKSSYHENWVLDTVFSVDGQQLVSVGRDRAARLASVKSGSFLETVNKLRGELSCVARHPTRNVVVIGGDDRVPYYYKMERSKKMRIADDSSLIRELEMQKGAIFAVAFHPDGRSLVVAGAAPEAPLYDVESGERIAALIGHKAGIYTVRFHPSGDEVATAGFDGKVRIYDARSGKIIREFVPAPIEESTETATAR